MIRRYSARQWAFRCFARRAGAMLFDGMVWGVGLGVGLLAAAMMGGIL